MTDSVQLPSYLEQGPAVSKRFRQLQERPVKLRAESLSKTFETAKGKVRALRELSFDVHRRDITVIGPSGCGKTTLIRILAGLDFPTSGQVLLEGKKVHGPSADQGMVFQDYTLLPWLTVKKNGCSVWKSKASGGSKRRRKQGNG